MPKRACVESIRFRPPHASSCDVSLLRGMDDPGGKTAAEVARELADVLERRKLRYAVGGTLALGLYAPPRATVDVDVNIFVTPARQLDRALAALREVGFVPEREVEST